MNTLTLKEAAKILHMHPQTLREKADAGIIPGSKPGKQWVFVESRLLSYLDSISPCQSIKSEISGTSTFAPLRGGLGDLLALPTGKPRRNITTKSRRGHGEKTG